MVVKEYPQNINNQVRRIEKRSRREATIVSSIFEEDEGDIITDLDGQRITSYAQLAEVVRQHQAGDKVTVGINRAGDRLEIEAVLDLIVTPRAS